MEQTDIKSVPGIQKEVLLLKYGEIVLKGANRRYFEDMLLSQIRRKCRRYGHFTVRSCQSTVYVEPEDGDADIDGAEAAVCRVFGIISMARAAVCDKDMAVIERTAVAYLAPALPRGTSFKVEARRSDKRFAYDSMEISANVGAALLSGLRGLTVDVHNPDVTVRVEIREESAYVHAGNKPAAGGMPVGSNGRGLLLLSGGIDSPVAGYMMAKRGMTVEAIHFESAPYTSPQALDKVVRLGRILSEYNHDELLLHIVSLTHIQEELVRVCDEEYFTLMLRRFMMTIADRAADKFNCLGIITGESLGQVASQTAAAMAVTDPCANRPVYRPCVGLDKEEIVKIARKIDTFDTSIEPYEDCCTVFTPRHPRTRPVLEKVLEQQAKLDFDALVDEALAGMYRKVITPDDGGEVTV